MSFSGTTSGNRAAGRGAPLAQPLPAACSACLRPPFRGVGAAAAVVLAALLGLLPQAPASAAPAMPVLARVNGEPVPRLAVEIQVNRILPMASYHGSVDQETWGRVVDQAVQAAAEQTAIAQAARKEGLKISGKQLDGLEESWVQKAGSKEAFKSWLEQQGLSSDEFREVLRNDQLAEALESKAAAKFEARPPPSDADLRKYYDENREKFMRPPSMDIQHILFRVQPWQPQAEWARVKKRADWIAKRARSGEDFAHLAELYSDDAATKDQGGRMLGVHEGALTAPLQNLAAGLKPGAIGGPVRSLYGYHILKLLARHPARQLDFADLDRDRLRADLRRQRIADAKEAWRRGLLKDARIELDRSQIDLLRRAAGIESHGLHGGARRAE